MPNSSDVIIIGSGMGSLSAAVLLAKEGKKVRILEQNWLPGGCTSSYPRKHFIFESGATTLVGLDEGMPLQHLLQTTGISLKAHRLHPPMRVYFPDGSSATRFESLDDWIAEAERVFGPKNQRKFWEYCFGIAKIVWETSIRQRRFPPKTAGDLWHVARHARFSDFKFATLAYKSVKGLLEQHGLWENIKFRQFVNEQLLITAQNTAEEVNLLFGATALCYTNFGNYYLFGGMIKLVEPLIEFLEKNGGEIIYREKVESVRRIEKGYQIVTDFRGKKSEYEAEYVVSGIPLNDTLPLFNGEIPQKLHKKVLDTPKLKGAVTMGIVFKRHRDPEILHHQIILDNPLPGSKTDSFFVSLSHPEDHERCGPDETVANISTHVHDPAATQLDPAAQVQFEEEIIRKMAEIGLLKPENVIFQHSSTPGSWYKWTHRYHGFVGGYPQYMSIKPWQMVESRLDGKGAYICGDSTYPGQGIPGACLSGIVAFEKLKADHF